LKIPDGVSGNVKCPKCGTIFPFAAKPAAAPAFEVVDAKPAPASKITPKPPPTATNTPKLSPPTTTTPKTTPTPATAPKPATTLPQSAGFDFDVVDEKPKKRVVARSSRDDDDEDEKPKKKTKGKSRVYEDDDIEEWRPSSGGKRGAFGKGKTGSLLLGISFWLNLGAYGLLALYALIIWIMVLSASSSSPSSRRGGGGSGDSDGSFMEVLIVLPGLVGLGAWIVGTIGCSIAIAGPARARGMAITATVFAALHLVLTGVTFSNLRDDLSFASGVPIVGSLAWIAVASALPFLDAFLPLIFYQSRAIRGDYIIALLAAVCEVLRLIFALLTLKAIAAAARDYDAAEKAQFGVITTSFIVGGVMIVVLIMAVILREGKFKSAETYANLIAVTVLLMYGAYTAMMFVPAMAAMMTKDACARRT